MAITSVVYGNNIGQMHDPQNVFLVYCKMFTQSARGYANVVYNFNVYVVFVSSTSVVHFATSIPHRINKIWRFYWRREQLEIMSILMLRWISLVCGHAGSSWPYLGHVWRSRSKVQTSRSHDERYILQLLRMHVTMRDKSNVAKSTPEFETVG